MTCHNCKIDAGKFGFFKGFQRYRCKQCHKTFSDIPERPLDNLRIEPEKAIQAIHLLCEGMGIRAIERLTGIHRDTVLNVLETAGDKCARLMEEKAKGLTVRDVQVDELYAFVECLQQNTEVGDQLRGDQYTFLAIERNTKFIIHSLVGKRDKGNAYAFLTGLKHRINGRFQLSTDSFAAYCGQIGTVWQVFRESIDYATETKHFATDFHVTGKMVPRRENPKRCQWVKRIAQIGKPNMKRVTTNHAERTNLSVRLFNRRFTRKTLGYSKTLKNLKHSVSLLVAHFNFCRPHSRLKIEATETTPSQERTPAMAQGITDHVWTIAELLGPGN